MYGQLGNGNDSICNNTPIRILTNIKDIFAGSSASFAVAEDNTLWMCGTIFGNHTNNITLDQIIPKEVLNDTKEISVHYKRSLILKTDNTLWQYSFDENKEDIMAAKIIEDINCISKWTYDAEDKTLVLKNNGELYMYNLDVGGYTLEKIMDDVKLPKITNDFLAKKKLYRYIRQIGGNKKRN